MEGILVLNFTVTLVLLYCWFFIKYENPKDKSLVKFLMFISPFFGTVVLFWAVCSWIVDNNGKKERKFW